jgi:hypothetical protein
VVAVRTGVVKLLPEPTDEPPVGEVYQVAVPADGVATKLTVPDPHTLPGVVDTIEGVAFTVMTKF